MLFNVKTPINCIFLFENSSIYTSFTCGKVEYPINKHSGYNFFIYLLAAVIGSGEDVSCEGYSKISNRISQPIVTSSFFSSIVNASVLAHAKQYGVPPAGYNTTSRKQSLITGSIASGAVSVVF